MSRKFQLKIGAGIGAEFRPLRTSPKKIPRFSLYLDLCTCFSLFFFPAISRKTRIIDVVYNASNNELVRTKTLVKSCIVQVDGTPFRQWYEAHYAAPLGRKKGVKLVRPKKL